MSALSELRERVAELENRLDTVEKILLRIVSDKQNIQDHSIDMVKVDEDDSEIETRTRIGYKPSK